MTGIRKFLLTSRNGSKLNEKYQETAPSQEEFFMKELCDIMCKNTCDYVNQVCTSLRHLCWNLYTFSRARLFNYHRDLQSVHACTTWNFWFFVSPKGLGAKCTITWQEAGEGGEGGRGQEKEGKGWGVGRQCSA